ncbi:hypothetical protein E2C01_058087 [Portunus trituberculatus]|uniref:Uncharacterized protein n=1 Tax=Portunus trituberculatus TaxID=210409 RepID=A0A5B7H4C7_PORTR|nr:hypothetical protein [Portunus trituberculatus]
MDSFDSHSAAAWGGKALQSYVHCESDVRDSTSPAFSYDLYTQIPSTLTHWRCVPMFSWRISSLSPTVL